METGEIFRCLPGIPTSVLRDVTAPFIPVAGIGLVAFRTCFPDSFRGGYVYRCLAMTTMANP